MTPNAYAHQLLTGHLARLRSHPRVVADLANRRAYTAESSDVVPLPGPDEAPNLGSSTGSEGPAAARE